MNISESLRTGGKARSSKKFVERRASSPVQPSEPRQMSAQTPLGRVRRTGEGACHSTNCLTSCAAICVNHSSSSTPRNPSRTGGIMEAIATDQAPKAIGPYSQAIRAQGLIFTSGQVAIDPTTQQVVTGDVSAQTDRVLKNLAAILQASGSTLEKVLRCTVFLKNMGDFAAMNEVYGRYFKQAPPARSTVEVARLPEDALVEIDVIALA